jgi:hypothetical protein
LLHHKRLLAEKPLRGRSQREPDQRLRDRCRPTTARSRLRHQRERYLHKDLRQLLCDPSFARFESVRARRWEEAPSFSRRSNRCHEHIGSRAPRIPGANAEPPCENVLWPGARCMLHTSHGADCELNGAHKCIAALRCAVQVACCRTHLQTSKAWSASALRGGCRCHSCSACSMATELGVGQLPGSFHIFNESQQFPAKRRF